MTGLFEFKVMPFGLGNTPEANGCGGIHGGVHRRTNLLTHVMLGVAKLNTTAHHPQCNGMIERMNWAMLRKHSARFARSGISTCHLGASYSDTIFGS